MKALILVDIQNDFLPDGALPVPDGDAVVPVANEMQKRFETIVATQDWHPPDHGSFARNHPGKEPGEVTELNGLEQILWPPHCVQGSPGAEFARGLDTSRVAQVFRKGTDPGVDSYSGFFDNGRKSSTGLEEWLKKQGVTDVYLVGLATDYCVKATALDARELGFNTFLIRDGCRGVNKEEGDVDKALDEMAEAGVVIVDSDLLMV